MLSVCRLIVIASLFVLISVAQAEGPAVSNINGKLEIIGGFLDGDGTGIAGASMALPLGHYLGLQLDVAGGNTDSDDVVGYGSHLFLRDPDVGLLGALLTRTGRSGDYVNRYGFEGEYYAARWTLAANGGTQTGFLGGTWHADIDGRYYLHDNLVLDAGASGFSDEKLTHFGVEWRSQNFNFIPGLSLFADAGVGTEDNDYVFAGVRIYFGMNDRTLKQQHRENDPINSVISAAAGLSGAISTKQQSGSAAGAAGGVGGGMTQINPPPSDMRLKRDIVNLVTLANGIKLYSFRYLWDDTVYVGVMAQDLLTHESYRDAVIITKAGFYSVDYEMLGLRMITLNEWNLEQHSIGTN
jgi:Chaperone of endosialidase